MSDYEISDEDRAAIESIKSPGLTKTEVQDVQI